MTFEFFEGAAGTGKTHNLVGRGAELVHEGVLAEGQKLLALTFMNGSRRRLDARLGENPIFRRRFDCQTFDVFARWLAARRRSLITPEMQQDAAALNEFDGPCALAAGLLEQEVVCRWVARSYPLILVDEAQDLDQYRLRILQALSLACRVVAAADAFQCLHDGRDTRSLMAWFEGAGRTHRLTDPKRTNQQGLLNAAHAIREGSDIKEALPTNSYNGRTTWGGGGFLLTETTATNRNTGLLAWSIANEISKRQGPVVILTPDSSNSIVRAALATVAQRPWSRQNGATFGPYPHVWDRNDTQDADGVLGEVELPDTASFAHLRALLTPLNQQADIARALGRIDRLRRTSGQAEFTSDQVAEFVRTAARNRLRFSDRRQRGHMAMTIQRAKNLEFPNVIVLWPHTATGSPEHLRRLLYNGITRAQSHCTVIVLGAGRLNAAPFAP